MNAAPELVRFNDVGKTFGRLRTLAGVSFAVAAGEFVALIGPPGGGKTTILHLAAGLELPDRGTVSVSGLVVRNRRRDLYDRIGLVFGDADIGPDKGVGAALRDVGRLHGLTDEAIEARVMVLMERFDLRDHQRDRLRALRPLDRRRMHLAAAVLHQPALLLLTDLTRGLDHAAANQIVADIAELHRDERLAVLMCIEQPDLAALADRVIVLDHGEVIANAAPTALLEQSGVASLSAAVVTLSAETA